MMNQRSTRREFSVKLATLVPALSLAGTSLATTSATVAAAGDIPAAVISRTAEAIHQEVVFRASPNRVYKVLTDTKQFDKIVELSGVMQSGMLPPGSNKPTQISSEVGGSFVPFGGYITGRHIELVPGVRVVQAWRVGAWSAGVYSIAKFELVEQGSATKMVFDHTGFPKGDAEGLASGWNKHYWEPLVKFLS
jgi:activator of HSP90 ATPase